jgi:hypothetical protein
VMMMTMKMMKKMMMTVMMMMMMMPLLLFYVTAIALDWLHVTVSAARGLQDIFVQTPPCGVGNVKLVYFRHCFFPIDTGAAMAASRTRVRHTPCCA